MVVFQADIGDRENHRGKIYAGIGIADKQTFLKGGQQGRQHVVYVFPGMKFEMKNQGCDGLLLPRGHGDGANLDGGLHSVVLVS